MKPNIPLIALVLLSTSIISCDYNANVTHTIESVCLFITLISVCIALKYYHLYRKSKQQNKELVDTITNNANYKMLYERLRDKEVLITLTETPTESPSTYKDINKLNDEQLFIFLSDIIQNEKLFLNPKFGRQNLIDRFHISSHRIGAAFSKGSKHKSLPDFIRECRLEHACKLLKQTNLNINDIITASGFSLASSFNHVFKERYSISPTEYREQIQTESEPNA